MAILLTLFVYFTVLLLISKLTTRKATNGVFFKANNTSPWYMVAFGMIGASISGVTFVSVPGMVNNISMTYLQTCMGFIVGYVLVSFVLLPVYYRLNLTTIYSFLEQRFGVYAYKTGAIFFLLAKMIGSAIRFYVVCIILQQFVLNAFGIPFYVTVLAMVLLIWLYTYRGGIKTLVFTDVFQTFCMLTALILIIYGVVDALGMSMSEAITAVWNDPRSKIFEWNEASSTQYFWKQFFSGAFIVVVMTGLDQDMMQKNLTCKSLKEAQKDMCTYGLSFLPTNFLFLFLGVLLSLLATQQGIALPKAGDELLPMFAATGNLGQLVLVLFSIGIIAASFSSADSALTALTTTMCIDVCNKPENESFRKRIHIAIAIVFALFILIFKALNNTSAIDAIYIMCAYTYGPLLGLFAFGLFTRHKLHDRFVPYVAILAPCLCWTLSYVSENWWGYKFGYELLLINGALSFLGFYLLKRSK